ncbi:MAG: RNA degradosome polyphosphate kinase [Sphingomonadaceae bacterium]|jgi:polyphosphate kinase|nr:RNA degradosome polyphosphate kinase [Sphingomonadaceae bacterium]MCB2085873.1 RNA degradosome polyphosphate kinase [Sphingomonadaceae bacterium]MCP5383228.1 RNA degradosome polyphosphate kinase [Altererythrobacter sp.]MCP5391854.1 RNA degradosome polyphosphate kinase [Sphingomonadaceae bacterium]MCP5393405.1 RNA degradosome polyphosphate kinase [Sphingomonadaceae bacterium]
MSSQIAANLDEHYEHSEEAADRYINRELSWLAFNTRVLAEARNENYPLLERLRFLSISGSNLDEFMMIRVAGLVGQVQRGIERVSIDGRSPSQQLAAIREAVLEINQRQREKWAELRELLGEAGITIANNVRVEPESYAALKEYFLDEIVPVLTPQALDPAHPFPFVANEGLGLLFTLTRKSDNTQIVEMVLVPTALPRWVRVPGEKAVYISIERLICRFADHMFPGFTIEGDGAFRVLRDSDIEIEEEAEDLVRTFRSAIQRRRRGQVIQLELEEDFDPVAEAVLLEQMASGETTIIRTDGLIGVDGLADIVAEDRPDLKFSSYSPRYPERVMEHDGDCFAAIREKDIVIHHPYESFEVVVDFLRQAAKDPDVVAIKQTLYRAGSQSTVIAALIAAAEAGKSVTAVVELKARFDEEQNLLWASELERAGVQVIYGFVDWKTHAKVSMVVRREGASYRTYCHFGTGNYHPVTAKIYTDLSYFTADPKIGRDAARMFNFVTGYVEPRKTGQLAISPIGLREKIYERVDKEIENAAAGKPAGIWAKLNSLTDQGVIDRLYAASQAGVEVQLVIRGICCLRAGVEGLSENIRVKSIVGRFLEHSRIWAFANGDAIPGAKSKVYITSADAMSRNLDRRVEVMVPIRNKTVHDQVLQQVLLANLLDTEQSWEQQPDGTYARMEPGDKPFNCHRYFMTNPSLSGRGGSLEAGAVPKLALRRGAV